MEFYYPIRNEETPLHIKPGNRVTVTFRGDDIKNADRLHMTGETNTFYQWKNEPDRPILYRHIDDSLNTEKAVHDQYCLMLTSDGTYPVLAYHKITFPPVLSYLKLNVYDDQWILGISVSGTNVALQEGGYLRFRGEYYRKQEGDAPYSVNREPDEIFNIDLPLGTYEMTDLSKVITFDAKNAAALCLYLEGEGFTGTVYAERPKLCASSGWNMAPPFAPNVEERPQFTWYGMNLSRQEWVKLSLALNGKTFFEGEIFERCHCRSESEIPLNGAEILAGENQLTVTLTSDYRDPVAYNLFDVGIIGTDPSFLVACPKVVTAGEVFPVFVEGKKGESVALSGNGVRGCDLTLSEDGLNAILLCCDTPANNVKFTLKYQGQTEECTLERCVVRPQDNVTTGTGDMIYVNNEDFDVDNYLKWYFSNQVGNLLTIRPSYRWSGIRRRNEARWNKTARLLNKAGIKFAHMMDARELPGCDTNPSFKALDGEHFLGRQTHELDGAFSYWGVWDRTGKPSEIAFHELFLRRGRTHGHTMSPLRADPTLTIEKEGRYVRFRDITLPDDMEIASNYVVDKLALCKNGATRHTGPSTLFKYFYQAGYDWTGAELMYGPQEATCAALRGATKAHHTPTMGAHHAIQWSTTPHDCPEKNRRYRLALYGTYMQGVHDINTEEGLWHVEEYYNGYNRFSDCCLNHKKEQQEFYRYVQTHSRTGEFHTPIAFLHGRYDGWDTFTRKKVWGKESMGFTEVEKGWDLLTHFYPRNTLSSHYRHPCPKESVGFHSGTPYGNVDMYPIEAECFDDYRLLIAAGYNKALPEDFDKLQAYTERGGRLILGWPQCSETTLRRDVLALRHTYLQHPFLKTICTEGEFAEDFYNGMPITVGVSIPLNATPILATDSGRPLAYKIPVGAGEVIFVNAKQYAGDPAVFAAYQAIFAMTVPSVLAQETVYGAGDEDVQFAVFRQPDGSHHVYFMATDWYNDDPAPRKGTLLVGKDAYTVPAPMGTPVKAVVKDGIALWSHDTECDILTMEGSTARLQGIGVGRFTLARNGTTEEITVDFTKASLQTLKI